jgi:diaminopimelate decarboxylase
MTGGTVEMYEMGKQTKRPFISPQKLFELTERYSTPFYLYDEANIIKRAQLLQAAFSWNHGFKEYFAIKALPNPAIISLLVKLGCGCDCANGVELILADACGARGEAVVLSSNDTFDADFAAAACMGALINLDSLELVDDCARVLNDQMPDEILLRINPGGNFGSSDSAHFIGDPVHSKFGMTEDQAIEAARRLGHLGVKKVGVHGLLASNAQGQDYYPALARLLFRVAARIHQQTGLEIGHIDLSGGVGIAYNPCDIPPDITAIGQGVQEAFEEILVPAGLGSVRLMCELGRWLTGPCGALITRIIHEKKTYRDYLGVDACAADLIRPAMYGAYHHITVMGQPGREELWDTSATKSYSVVGGLCENSDQFAADRMLPAANVGDLLFVHDAGAHGHAMGYNYNGRLRSKELLLHADGTTELIRRAETAKDYFATLDQTSWWPRLKSRLP